MDYINTKNFLYDRMLTVSRRRAATGKKIKAKQELTQVF